MRPDRWSAATGSAPSVERRSPSFRFSPMRAGWTSLSAEIVTKRAGTNSAVEEAASEDKNKKLRRLRRSFLFYPFLGIISTGRCSLKKLKGVVDYFFETGSEGVRWIFCDDGKIDWDSIKFIHEGDWLKIYGKGGEVLFVGKIKEDRRAGWKPYPRNPNFGQPAALGYWIHWTQKGWKPDDWARLFIRDEGQLPLRAELIKNKKTDS